MGGDGTPSPSSRAPTTTMLIRVVDKTATVEFQCGLRRRVVHFSQAGLRPW